MKNIIRILALLLTMLCIITAFAACSAENGGADNDKNNGSATKVEYYVNYKGTKIELDKKADSVLSALGEAKNKASLGDCGGFGLQTRYTYDNLVIYTVKNDSGETIDQISLASDLVETPKGICVGDTADDVIKAYGAPTVKNDTKIEYENGSLILKFGIESGEVKSINFIRITAK